MKPQDMGEYDLRVSPIVETFKPTWFDSIPWHLCRERELDEEDLFALGYMDMIEGHVCAAYVHLALAPHKIRSKTERTDFVVGWGAQQNWHGISLHRFLDQYHGRNISTRIEEQDKRRSEVPFTQKHSALIAGLAASTIPNSYTALYACMGYRNELMTMHGYGSLRSKVNKPRIHSVLDPLLRNIMSEEAKHAAYYKKLATEVLEGSKTLQSIVRRAMNWWFAIVGENYGGHANADRVIRHLFRDAEGNEFSRFIDKAVSSLPGLSGIIPMQKRVTLARKHTT